MNSTIKHAEISELRVYFNNLFNNKKNIYIYNVQSKQEIIIHSIYQKKKKEKGNHRSFNLSKEKKKKKETIIISSEMKSHKRKEK